MPQTFETLIVAMEKKRDALAREAETLTGAIDAVRRWMATARAETPSPRRPRAGRQSAAVRAALTTTPQPSAALAAAAGVSAKLTSTLLSQWKKKGLVAHSAKGWAARA